MIARLCFTFRNGEAARGFIGADHMPRPGTPLAQLTHAVAGTYLKAMNCFHQQRKCLVLAGFVALVGSSATSAAVYEVSEYGEVVRLDQPLPTTGLRAAAARQNQSGITSQATAERARVVQPIINAAANRFDVSPALVDAIAHTESHYRQKAVSSAGASGVMQLMPLTAKALGVVDPQDAVANIHGGTAYLRQLLDRYDGDVLCAIAAYNAGPRAVTRQRCVPPFKETRAYVAKVMERLSDAAR